MYDVPSEAHEALRATQKTLKLTDPWDWASKIIIPFLTTVIAYLLGGVWATAAFFGIVAVVFIGVSLWLWNLIAVRQSRTAALLRAEFRSDFAAINDRLAMLHDALLRIEGNDQHPILIELNAVHEAQLAQSQRIDNVGLLARRAQESQSILGRFDEFEQLIERVLESQPIPLAAIGIVRGGPEYRWGDAVNHIRVHLRTFHWIDAVSLFPVTVNQQWREENDVLVEMEPGDDLLYRDVHYKRAYAAFLESVKQSGELLQSIKSSLMEAQKWTSLAELAPDRNL